MKNVYRVGGYVRDTLIGIRPKDVDYVVVGSNTEEMIANGYKQVGSDFPVFLDPTNGEEYALARTERKTGKGYSGFSVETENVTLKEDLSRRDLTINAMAMDEDGVVIDYFGGQKDIKDKILRHIDAEAFKEDPVRVLRIGRFLARWTDFVPAPDTIKLCQQIVQNGEMEHLTAERVFKEMEKALQEVRPSRFFYFLEMVGALEIVFPEIHALTKTPAGSFLHHPEGSSFIHTMMVLDEACYNSYQSELQTLINFCALTHDLGKGTTSPDILPHHYGHEVRGKWIVEKMCDRLKMPTEWKKAAMVVAEFHTHIHNFHKLNAKTIVKLFDSMNTRSIREIALILTCVSEADHRGRTSFYAHRNYPNGDIAYDVFYGLDRVRLSKLKTPEEIKELTVGQIKDIIYKEKIRVVKQTMKELYE